MHPHGRQSIQGINDGDISHFYNPILSVENLRACYLICVFLHMYILYSSIVSTENLIADSLP